MLAAGDEMGHTQQGNNNPYCQDNPITWIEWSRADEALIGYSAHLIALRRSLLPLADTWHADAAGDAGCPGCGRMASRCPARIGTTMRRALSACASVSRGARHGPCCCW